jgi:hypothetical protein
MIDDPATLIRVWFQPSPSFKSEELSKINLPEYQDFYLHQTVQDLLPGRDPYILRCLHPGNEKSYGPYLLNQETKLIDLIRIGHSLTVEVSPFPTLPRGTIFLPCRPSLESLSSADDPEVPG